MEQRLVQEQIQKQVQQQRLTQQQMMLVKMLEMPLSEMEESVKAELDDNPALERVSEADDASGSADMDEGDTPDDGYDTPDEREERKDALDAALEQMGMEDLSDTDRDIMEYLIGSLDEDGLLHKPISTICDELAIYNNIDVAEADIERVLHILQTFDPPGVGARSLQECLLLQIERRPDGRMKDLMRRVITSYFTAFTRKHWDKIQQELQLTDLQARTLMGELVKLNPKPGASLGETEGRNLQQITPDFIIDPVDDEGHINFTLNHGDLPELRVSPTFAGMIDAYKKNKASMNRKDKEALLYAKEKVDKAQGFIKAIKQRQHTLTVTMRAIIDWQRQFFLDGDESDLRPMILKDIAGVTGLDISTISRVANVKYAQTQWGIFPLKFFFSDGYVGSDGEETSTRRLRIALKELIDHEDKSRPLSDDALAEQMKKQGFPVARRTVAKYRMQLGIPVARLRK